MTLSDFRAKAREKLSGKWTKAAGITLIYFLVAALLDWIDSSVEQYSNYSIVSLVIAIVEVPLSFGFIASFLKLFKDETVGAFDFITYGFKNFGKSWGISLMIFAKMLLPMLAILAAYMLIVFGITSSIVEPVTAYYYYIYTSSFSVISLIGLILFVVAIIWSIIRSFNYQLSYLIASENPEMTSKDCVNKSAELMKGNRATYFCLQLSFIGWAILACFTFGIGFLWLAPYMQFAITAFYKNLLNDSNKVEIIDNNDLDKE